MIISASMYALSIDPAGIRDDATQAHRSDVFVRPCVNVHHMLPSVDLNFKSTVKSDLRASTLIDTHRSVIEPECSKLETSANPPLAHVQGIEDPRLRCTQHLSFEEDEYDSVEKFSSKLSKCWIC
ncbi:Uncharacterized protein DBV15_08985 [Temnothorax longispinosus]|uniref:Uncharacterized protein n=1 Tax=Temnothorax longispinosus TaxID=300112 RepID=A0A4S2JGF9_9HYME|nr:Uncharacterized protein DBV15_08985 [Temnothorax longispinosus]